MEFMGEASAFLFDAVESGADVFDFDFPASRT